MAKLYSGPKTLSLSERDRDLLGEALLIVQQQRVAWSAGTNRLEAEEAAEMLRLRVVAPNQQPTKGEKLRGVLQAIDTIAERAIRDELDIPPLKRGELCPLRAIVDIAFRARNVIV